MGEHQIESRENKGLLQYDACQIIEALIPYKTTSTFAMLGVTNHDLWRGDKNFIAGLADQDNSTGVFSFCRLDVKFPDGVNWNVPPEKEAEAWLKRSCRVMCHELAHMFGLKHCIYYECMMNGSNGPFEGVRRPNVTMCPVCLTKLQMNIKFDAKARFERLIEVSLELGFEESARSY